MTTSTTTHENAQAAAGRDAQGRFAKGNRGGPGNPFARKVALVRQPLLSFVTEEDLKEVAFILLQLAKRVQKGVQKWDATRS